MAMKLLLLLVAISLCVLQASAACSGGSGDTSIFPTDYTTTFSGEATYYGTYTNGGACSLDPTPPVGTASSIFATVAIADNIWAGSKACGMCVQLTANGVGSGASPLTGTYTVFVNNECPSCTNNGIDLGLNGDGIWDITWKAVPCPVGSSKIQFVFQGSNNYYIKLQVRNTRYPVYGVSILQSGTYRPLVRTADNFFTAGSSVTFPLVFPLAVQVTAVNGDVITDSIPSLTNGVVIQGSAQFLDCSGTSSGSATSTTTAKAATTTTTTAKAATTTTTAKATTTTTTGKTATTGSGSTTGSVAQTYVYQDGLNTALFQDWSWATVNPAVTSPAYGSTGKSYGVTFSGWAGAYFHCNTAGCISPSKFASVQFYIYASFVIANNRVTFALTSDANGAGAALTFSAPNINAWNKVTLSLSSYTASTYDGLWFQDSTGGAQPQIYLDEILFIGK